MSMSKTTTRSSCASRDAVLLLYESTPAPVYKTALADAHYTRVLLRKSIQRWRAVNRLARVAWKPELLAKHHAQYARLWTAFSVWRQRTHNAQQRKQVRMRVY